MSETTNLKLFKQDNPTTNTNNFDIEKTLNENWDKLDENAGTTNKKLESLEKVDSTTNETITAIQEEQTTQNENIEKNAEGIAQNKKDVDEELTKIKKENSLLKSQIPQGTASGNNIHLGDSSNMDFEWRLNGGSKQEITGGYNLCKSSSYNDSNLMLFFNPADITNKTITISLETNVELLGNSIYINSPIDAFHRLVAAISGRANERITSTFTLKDDDYAEIKNLREPRFLIYKDEAGFNEVINPQIVLGDIDKLYEPYTGGTPSPNPKYPSKIENVENDVKMTVYNKNLFDGNFTTNGIWNDDGSINYVIQSKLYWRTDFIKIPNKNIYFSSKQLNIFSSARLLEFDADKKYITSNKIYQVNSNLNKVSLNESTRFIAIQWNLQNATEIEGLFTDFQIEVGPTASPYISHQEQTIIFPLAEGQKLYEGSYLAEDGIHNRRKQIVLTGNGNWYMITNISTTKTQAFCLNNIVNNISVNHVTFKSNYFVHKKWIDAIYVHLDEPYMSQTDTTNIYLNIYKSLLPSVDATGFKSWLKSLYDAGKPVKIEYPLAKEEIIPYTQEQQAVIDKILYTYKNVTNISVDDELATLDITYKKDIETMFNNQAKEYNERLSNIESLLNTTSTSALLLDNLESDLEKEV